MTNQRRTIHLVSFGSRRFLHRQFFLGASARLNHVADSITAWSPEKLMAMGFAQRVKGIRFDERGSGFWAWKPFVIEQKLAEVPDGDIVFYCDVGRRYPFKLLNRTLDPYFAWMGEQGQDCMPGVRIPWKGPMSVWTKRDALVLTGMDSPAVHQAIPIQASFSIWRACDFTRAFVTEWMDLCSDRRLVSDDPSTCGLPELPDFHEHRHDQSLLTLCCLKHGLNALDIGEKMPPIDTQHPSEVAHWFSNQESCTRFAGYALRGVIWPLEQIERRLRSQVKFGVPRTEPNFLQ